jgi:hypothetical protein
MVSWGKIVYEAYREHTSGVSLVSGEPLPEWNDLPAAIKSAWEYAAERLLYRA